jgi:hypothetical protein
MPTISGNAGGVGRRPLRLSVGGLEDATTFVVDRRGMAEVHRRGGHETDRAVDLPRDFRTIGYLGTAPWLMNS